jgi:hypothetical protein
MRLKSPDKCKGWLNEFCFNEENKNRFRNFKNNVGKMKKRNPVRAFSVYSNKKKYYDEEDYSPCANQYLKN